jgi:thioredoxin reductase (NADPH)
MELKDERKKVQTEKAIYESSAVIIASGAAYRHLGVAGEKEFQGRGISYCGLCDGPFFKNKRVIVVGGGNTAVITALYLAHLGSDVKVVHRRDAFRAEDALVQDLKNMKSIEVLWSTEIKEIGGEKSVKKVLVFDRKRSETREIPIDGVFVQIGEDPNSQRAKEAGVAVDQDGFIIADVLQHTNIDGVYAAGDVTNHPVKQLGVAVGQGITAGVEAYAFVRRPYYRK